MHQTRSGFFHYCLGPVCLSLNFIYIFGLYNTEYQQVQYLKYDQKQQQKKKPFLEIR